MNTFILLFLLITNRRPPCVYSVCVLRVCLLAVIWSLTQWTDLGTVSFVPEPQWSQCFGKWPMRTPACAAITSAAQLVSITRCVSKMRYSHTRLFYQENKTHVGWLKPSEAPNAYIMVWQKDIRSSLNDPLLSFNQIPIVTLQSWHEEEEECNKPLIPFYISCLALIPTPLILPWKREINLITAILPSIYQSASVQSSPPLQPPPSPLPPPPPSHPWRDWLSVQSGLFSRRRHHVGTPVPSPLPGRSTIAHVRVSHQWRVYLWASVRILLAHFEDRRCLCLVLGNGRMPVIAPTSWHTGRLDQGFSLLSLAPALRLMRLAVIAGFFAIDCPDPQAGPYIYFITR